jgi:hypothetical protein
MQSSSKGKKGKQLNKRKPNPAQAQRAWSYLQDNSPSTLVSPPPYAKDKGKGDSKGKGKGKPKGKGKQSRKGKSFSKGGWNNPKGKSKGLDPKGKRIPKGNPSIQGRFSK